MLLYAGIVNNRNICLTQFWEMKMKRLIMSGLMVTSILITGVASASIVNGSFEAPDVKSGSWQVFTDIPGWIATGAGAEVRDNVAGSAYDGDQFIELDSYSNSAIEQTIDTIAGSPYEITWAYSPRMGKLNANTNGIAIYWNDELLDEIALSGVGNSDNVWTLLTTDVTGSGSDTLKFVATGVSDAMGGSLDAISIQVVPVPAAVWLFGSALAGLLSLRRLSVKAD
jgi:hypothetical protein